MLLYSHVIVLLQKEELWIDSLRCQLGFEFRASWATDLVAGNCGRTHPHPPKINTCTLQRSGATRELATQSYAGNGRA